MALFDRQSTFAFVSCNLPWDSKGSWSVVQPNSFANATFVVSFDYIKKPA
ncbi:MAG: hypothetical protein KatS3mg109_0052 [Pirellulaceae bacterium]|nr:MAG: hypothetical protein KatS3mg109_0052 [Pirellulaceae bacterium]